MNRLASAVAVLAVLSSTLQARAEGSAQPVPPAPAQPDQAPPVVETAPVDTPEDPWTLYERAFAAAVAGRDEEALAALATLKAAHPASGAAALGGELERQLLARKGQPVPAADAGLRRALEEEAAEGPGPSGPSVSGPRRYATLFEALHDETPNAAARAEFIVFQTLHGIAVGAEVCAATSGCGGVAAGVLLLPMLTGAAGALGAYKFSEGGITPGQALAIDSGVLWGAWHGLALTTIAGGWSSSASPLLLILAQGLGMGAGQLAWARLGLGAGDVSLMNTAGTWAGIYTLMALGLAGTSGTTEALFTVLLVASDVGLVVGGLLSRHFPMSRGRTLLLDAGAILGGLMGLAVYVITQSSFSTPVLGYMLGGSVAGLAAAALLSQNWDAPLLGPVQVGMAPTPHGGGQLVISGRF